MRRMKMKNRLTKITLITTLVLAGVIASSVTYAKEITTRADVQFKPADKNKPVDPHDPEKPKPEVVDPDPEIKPPVVYPGGPLRLNHVPSLSFGINEINAGGQTINALLENVLEKSTGTVLPRASFIEVADETGSLRGWKVTAKSDGVFKSARGNIVGTITFSDPAIRGINGMENKPEVAPTGSAFSIGKDFEQSANVLTAEKDKGYNIWQARYGHSESAVEDKDKIKRNPNVKLTVPAGQLLLVDTSYVAEIQWSLVQGL